MKSLFKRIVITLLSLEARILIRRMQPTVIAITGSLGKTGTKDAIASVLASTYSVRKSPKSFNSEFGVPLTILGLDNAWNSPFGWIKNLIRGLSASMTRSYPDMLVVEVGADKPGDIAHIAKWLPMDVAIITAVPEVPVHIVYYPTSASVLKEKGSLINGLKEGGLLITGDDARVAQLSNPHGKTLRVSQPQGEIVYENENPVGMTFIIQGHTVMLPGVLGVHQGYAPALALAVGEHFGIAFDTAVQALSTREYTPGRMRLLPGIAGSTIIDDSYNSSPQALAAALNTLKSIRTPGRKIAILGDMRELGSFTEREHRNAGELVASIVDELYTVGEYTPILAQSAREHGLVPIHIYAVHEAQKAGEECAKRLQAHDVVLVKSSQGALRLEKAVKTLMRNPDDAPKLLVRQDEEWLKR